MKIAFIRLNMFEHISSDAMKPILFGIIRALTPECHELVFYDERTDPLPEVIDADVIAFSVETYTAKRAYIHAQKYRGPGTVIVMGGFHAAVMPEEILGYADTVLIGDAEGTWPQFLADCAAGHPQRRYTADESVPMCPVTPAPGVYAHRYYGIGVYQISRGCKFNCDFCSIKTMYRHVRRKSAAQIVQELSAMPEKILFFADDNLFYEIGRAHV